MRKVITSNCRALLERETSRRKENNSQNGATNGIANHEGVSETSLSNSEEAGSSVDASQESPVASDLSSDSPAAYIACTRRNNETITEFLAALSEEDLDYSIVYQATLDTESALFVYNESHIPVKVYKVTFSPKQPQTTEWVSS